MRYYTGVGSRETPERVLKIMTFLARFLAARGFILRSGAADGADSAFEAGAGTNKEIWVPYLGFNRHPSRLLPIPAAFEMVEDIGWDGPREYMNFHARNCHQVLGPNLDDPSEFLICWTPDGKKKGGTATAIKVAGSFGVPVYNLGRDTEATGLRFMADFQKKYGG